MTLIFFQRLHPNLLKRILRFQQKTSRKTFTEDFWKSPENLLMTIWLQKLIWMLATAMLVQVIWHRVHNSLLLLFFKYQVRKYFFLINVPNFFMKNLFIYSFQFYFYLFLPWTKNLVKYNSISQLFLPSRGHP